MIGRNSRQRSSLTRSIYPIVTIFSIAIGSRFILSGSFFGSGSIGNFSADSGSLARAAVARTVPRERLLELNDLPPGFEVAPPLFRQMVTRAIARSGADLEKVNISVRDTAIFVNMEEAEMVTCVTMDLPDRTAKDAFDNRLHRGDGREVFQSGFRQVLRLLGEPKIEESRAIALERLGEAARGYHLAATIENFPVRVFADSLAFRREDTGVVLIVGSVGREPEQVRAPDLARALDRRLQSETAVGHQN